MKRLVKILIGGALCAISIALLKSTKSNKESVEPKDLYDHNNTEENDKESKSEEKPQPECSECDDDIDEEDTKEDYVMRYYHIQGSKNRIYDHIDSITKTMTRSDPIFEEDKWERECKFISYLYREADNTINEITRRDVQSERDQLVDEYISKTTEAYSDYKDKMKEEEDK